MEKANTGIKSYEERFLDFVEAAAHDLHAPLRKLSILIERVFTKHNGAFDEQAKEYVTRIKTCIEEMQTLIDGLTEFTKAEAPASIFTACDLNLITKETLEILREEIEAKGMEVHVSPLPEIQGNPGQYKQLFKNLFENAIKFSNEHIPARIDVKSESLNDEAKTRFNFPTGKKYYKIEIIDNGIGFNHAYAKKIFEPFIRLHSKSKYPGNGLGLSVSKKIVMNHHGLIYAERNQKEGSRFVLILPETPDHTC